MPDEEASPTPGQASLPQPALTLAPKIENIEIIKLLGQGGMSLVFLARQTQMDRLVAVKVLSRQAIGDEESIKRFQHEARLTSKLEHPNIVRTISFGVSRDSQPYLVLEYLEGVSLAEELKKNGRLSLKKFKNIFLPILEALAAAHELCLVHRDIKPANIMVCRDAGGDETIKLLDFGIARIVSGGENETHGFTRTGMLLGTPST